jgi:hypothetical protein
LKGAVQYLAKGVINAITNQLKKEKMKLRSKMKSLLLVAAVFAGSLAVSANGKVAVVPYLKTNYTLIAAESADAEFSSVAILDAYGETVYATRRIASQAVFSKVFDFSNLADGEYKVRLRAKSGSTLEEKFLVKSGALAPTTFSEMAEVSDNDVRIWSDKDFLFVSHLNRAMAPVVINVKDARGSVVYNTTLPADLTYSGKYDVAALPKGDYTISLLSGSKVYNYEFRK